MDQLAPQGGKEDELVEVLTQAVHAGDILTAQNIVIHLANLNLKLNITIDEDKNEQAVEKPFKITVQVEDRESSGVSFSLLVRSKDTIADLKKRVWLNYKFPVQVQRWIIGKRIQDDQATLKRCGVQTPTTVFLYLLPAHSAGLRNVSEAEAGMEEDNIVIDAGNMDDSMLAFQTVPSAESVALDQEKSLYDKTISFLSPEVMRPAALLGAEAGVMNFVDPIGLKTGWGEEEDDNQESEEEYASWECLHCTYKNSEEDTVCEICRCHRYQKKEAVDGLQADARGAIGGWQEMDAEGLERPSRAENTSLKIGDRIVWPSDQQEEKGTVRWIGTLPDVEGNMVTVGVEFDNEVGVGTGKYKDERLFTAKRGHAALIPLMGVYKDVVQEADA